MPGSAGGCVDGEWRSNLVPPLERAGLERLIHPNQCAVVALPGSLEAPCAAGTAGIWATVWSITA